MIAAVIGPGLLRPVSAILRTVAPICVIGRYAIVTRHADVVDVLARDGEFTVSHINAPAIDRHDGPFILGMDRGEEYDRNVAVLREAVRPADLERIRGFVAAEAAERLAAARTASILDVVNGYARLVAVRLVASYFGMPGPDERTMMRWLRDIFYDVFLNLNNDAKIRRAATDSGIALREHMKAIIAERKAQRGRGAPEANSHDDVLARLIAVQDSHPWLDDDTLRKNLSGLIVGAVETTSKFVTLATRELLRRPKMFARAREAALTGDRATLKRYVFEAARFNPHTPLLFRYCRDGARIAAGTRREKVLASGTTVVLGNLSAMFDPAAFTAPRSFQIEHDSAALHFGGGLHRCFGLAMNEIVIPELVAGLLALPALRPAAGGAGTMRWEGPFPDRYLVEFD